LEFAPLLLLTALLKGQGRNDFEILIEQTERLPFSKQIKFCNNIIENTI